MASRRSCSRCGGSGRNLGNINSPFCPNHSSCGFDDDSTDAAHFIARWSACRPSIPNTYLGRRQLVSRPVIWSAQPQSEPGTGRGTPSVSTTGFPLADWNTRRAAIRRIVRGAAIDLLIRPGGIVSGGPRRIRDISGDFPRDAESSALEFERSWSPARGGFRQAPLRFACEMAEHSRGHGVEGPVFGDGGAS